jgi:omega-6 fatty acid desaturase (delta-12 desaturase)
VPDLRKAIWQIVTTFIPFAALWALLVLSLRVGYWLTLPLAVLTAGIVIRVFIIQHDCGHGSFFRSRCANDVVGSICGVLTLVPYHYWRRTHAMHHASSGRLEQRGVGDIPTLTVGEYQQRSPWGRLRYRMFRHPLILFGVGPTVLFGLMYRFPKGSKRSWKVERASVAWTNVALLGVCTLMALAIGVRGFAAIQVPITMLAASMGAWLFYTQHQFEDAYWATAGDWNHADASPATSASTTSTILTRGSPATTCSGAIASTPSWRPRRC